MRLCGVAGGLAARSVCNLGEASVSPSRRVSAPPRNGNAQLFFFFCTPLVVSQIKLRARRSNLIFRALVCPPISSSPNKVHFEV